MSFDLTTIRLTTTFDAEQGTLPLGEPLTKGRHSAVVLVEGGHPPHHGVLRANRPTPLVGIRVPQASGAGPLRVVVVVQLDPEAWNRWSEHHAEGGGEPGFGPGAHRLLTISAQGVPRATCLLVPQDDGATRQRVQLHLGADEVGPDGLLVLGLEDAGAPPGWGTALPGGAVGAVISRVLVDAAGDGAGASVSTGVQPAKGERPVTTLTPGFLVANPGPSGSASLLRLHTPRPKPARIELVTTTGDRLFDETVAPAGDGAIEVPLGLLERPVLVRALDPKTGGVRRSYQVGVRARPASEGRP